MKMLAAKGVIPGAPPPAALTAVVGLSLSDDAEVVAAAKKTLESPPRPLLEGALGAQLQAPVVEALANHHGSDPTLLPKILAQESLDEDILCLLANRADEASGEIIGTNEALLLKFPRAIERLYMNKRVRMSTSDRLIELAVRNEIELDFPAYKLAAEAIMSQLIPEPCEEPTYDDVLFAKTDAEAESLTLEDDEDVCERDEEGQEQVAEKAVPLFKLIADANITQKIRLAQTGNSTVILFLVRDNNRLVSEAAAKSPRMTENDAARIASSRAVSDDVLRIIGNNREFTRSYQVKLNLVSNPRTPITFTTRFMPHLRQNDVKGLARSKQVPAVVQKLAKQQLARKK